MPKLHRIFEMPGLPPRVMSPNSRVDKHEVWAAKAMARSDMVAVVRNAGWFGPGAMYATLRITFVTNDKRRRDFDNLLAACKGWIDGLVVADVLQFDDTAHLDIDLRYQIDRDGEAKTLFEVTER